ncbi:PLP-dependent aminotransferase family protein [Arhodomonas sp. AD133]|uniref:MocR-like pyridoxine biosynthesis transcription factor PdxR n=1 Tax=Arhodomonas sp. AD133 TaxID=3415009 RepID=UPI003EC0B33F
MLIADLVLQSLQQQRDHRRLTLKRRVYAALRAAILDGRLPAGTRLPPTRELARDLGIGRNTALRAYDMLLAEGYVESRVGSGTFVSESLVEPPPAGRRGLTHAAPVVPRLSRRGRAIARHSSSSEIQYGAFMPGIPDVEAFPHATWRRLVGRYLDRRHARLMQYASGGYGPLKTALAEHLRVSRLIDCEPRQIMIVDGAHQGLDLCARMLADPGETAWIEDPGYWGARNVLRGAGLRLRPVLVDGEGIAPADDDWARPPRLIFTSPSYQYPTGAVLSLARRRLLLERAAATGAWIVEDDYDNELRYHREPIASLYGLAPAGQVIYVGTFSKVMYPGLRLGYLVVPPALVDAFATANAELFREGRLVEQAALAEFIEEGHFDAHIRRMRGLYAERQSALRERMDALLGDRVSLSGGQAGIHLLYRLPDTVDDKALAREALANGVISRPLSLYYHDAGAARPGLVLGYAGVSTERIPLAAERLVEVVERYIGGGH